MQNYKEQRWINGSGTLGGKAAYIRKNVSLKTVPRLSHPVTVMVTLVYQQRGPNGLPSDRGELSRLDASEEAIADQFCSECQALFGLAVTSDGSRDLFFFLPKTVDDHEANELMEIAEPKVDYDFRIIEDPEWEPYDLLDEAAGTP